MQSLMFLDCFVQKLSKKTFGSLGGRLDPPPPPLVKEGLNPSVQKVGKIKTAYRQCDND